MESGLSSLHLLMAEEISKYLIDVREVVCLEKSEVTVIIECISKFCFLNVFLIEIE